MRSQRALPPFLAAAAGVLALLPTLRMGFLRDDWLLLWSRLDPATAPARASGSFDRPVAEGWWALAVSVGRDAPGVAHALQLLCGLLLLFALWRLARRLEWQPAATACLLAMVGTHSALLELRLWAAASNGLLGLLLGCFALERFLAGKRLWAALLFLLALGSRSDAVALLPILFGLLAQRGTPRPTRRVLVLAGLLALGALFYSLREAGSGIAWRPEDAGRALRLLVLPWGSPLPELAARTLAFAGTLLLAVAALRLGVRRAQSWWIGTILAVAWSSSLMPWNVAGRYLALAILALGILLAVELPARRPLRFALVAWFAMQLISGLFGNTTRELLRRSHAETDLYRSLRDVEEEVGTVSLVDPPPMGWTDSEADAENIASVARRRLVAVRFSDGNETSELNELRLVYRDGRWRRYAAQR